MDVRDKHQIDMAGQVAKVRARARPWRSIIALVLAAIAAAASVWARGQNLILAGRPVDGLVSGACAVAFGLFALAATLGLSGKAREALEPRIGSAHAAVIRYAIVLAGGLASLLITLQLLNVSVTNLILGGAFTAVLIGIAAQQSLGNLFAGLVLLLARPFAVGDSVRMRAGVLSGQIDGVVTDIGITYVRLETDEGKLSVPNSQVLAAAVGPLRPQPSGGLGELGQAATAPSAAASAQSTAADQSARPAQPASGQPAPAGQADSPGQPIATAAAAGAPLGERAAPQQSGPDGAGSPDERGPQR